MSRGKIGFGAKQAKALARALANVRVHRDLFVANIGTAGEGEARLIKPNRPDKFRIPGALQKDADGKRGEPSNQAAWPGIKPRPFDFEHAKRLRVANGHHSTCLEAKIAATTGLGFKTEKAYDTLDPLCRDSSFHEVLNQVADDHYSLGAGAMEIVWDEGRTKIRGIYHLPIDDCWVNLENEDTKDWHYIIVSAEEMGVDRSFAKFGDLIRMRKAAEKGTTTYGHFADPRNSEVIIFPRRSNLSRWYSVPDWISAEAVIEVISAILQHNYDFFLNRGIPEFLLFVMGEELDDKTMGVLEDAMNAGHGQGKSRTSAIFNHQSELNIDLKKMGAEGLTEDFQHMLETLQLAIVSAHRVPPLLAGIQIPGKLGANNELPNALMAFQTLVIGQTQRAFQKVLGRTLGNAEMSGGLGLTEKDFEFKSILDYLDIQQMDAVGRSRTPVGGKDPGQPATVHQIKKALEESGGAKPWAAELLDALQGGDLKKALACALREMCSGAAA